VKSEEESSKIEERAKNQESRGKRKNISALVAKKNSEDNFFAKICVPIAREREIKHREQGS